MGLADKFHLERARFTSPKRGYFVDEAQYIVLSRQKTFFDEPEIQRRMDKDVSFRPVPLWTDEYSNLFRVLRKRH